MMRAAKGNMILAAGALMLALAACQKPMSHEVATVPVPAPASAPPAVIAPAPATIPHQADWRAVATDQDRARLRDWYGIWRRGVRAARDGGYATQIASQGDLLQPAFGLDDPAIPVGIYKCRTIKLGSKSAQGLAYVAYPYFRCRVTTGQGKTRFAKLTGSQRPVGTLYADDRQRQVFLGTLVLGDELGPVTYGSDRQRDVAAVVQRFGPQRWRFIFPSPAYESLADVMEVAPL